tara:strand:- start:190 stop:1083 length:894 start_codon:yes stop_codon:yes gene_type:complete
VGRRINFISNQEFPELNFDTLKNNSIFWLKKGKENWLITSTGLILVTAILILVFSEKIGQAASFGDFIAGFAGSLALLWLVAGYRMQAKELAIQREELKLQRIALQNQASELKNMSQFSAIEQVKSMIDMSLQRLSSSDGEITSPEHFFTSMMPGPEWKVLIESTDPEEIFSSFRKYSEKTEPANTFISNYVSAAKFYLKSTDNKSVDFSLSDEEFVVINHAWLKDIPYLSTYLFCVYQYSEQKINYMPAHKIFLLAFLIASIKSIGNPSIVKEGAVDELKEYLKEQGKELPAIART